MKSGVWYSICWSPRDYNNPNSFIELDGCPRFHFSESGKPTGLKGTLENTYQNLAVKEIFRTEIFVTDESGNDMPTHYRHGIFVPGQNLAYDKWLKSSFKINSAILEKVKIREELYQKKVFLEYSNRIIRHDMHSGINTYLPRGLSMLQAKLTPELIKDLKLGAALKMLERGLIHTKTVYQGVYAFTNLVKERAQLDKEVFNLREALDFYLKHTAYYASVELGELPNLEANKSLFCTAIDNFIRNGIKYNESKQKVKVWVTVEGEYLIVKDNGIGMTQEEFEELSLPFKRKEENFDGGSGLGLNIALAILKEHDCDIKVKSTEEPGTSLSIDLRRVLETQ